MWIYDPAKFTTANEERMFSEGYMHCQKARITHALANAQKIPGPEALTSAVRFIEQEAGISLTPDQLSQILALYPFPRAKLADYGWGDTVVREMIMDVVANVMANTRWPTGEDQVDITIFVARLRKAAIFMGYKAAEQASEQF